MLGVSRFLTALSDLVNLGVDPKGTSLELGGCEKD
jgi:hypothetical protein